MARLLGRPPIITICQLKGGTGRTTLATNLASALDARLIDVNDTSFSTAELWSKARGKEKPEYARVCNIKDFEAEFGRSTATIVADVTTRDLSSVQSICRFADLVLIPITPSVADLQSAERLERECQGHGELVFVWNKVRRAVPSEERLRADWVNWHKSAEFLPSFLSLRVAFSQSLADGRWVFEAGSKAGRAKDEMRGVVDDCRRFLPKKP